MIRRSSRAAGVELGSYALFSANRPNLLTLPSSKVFLKAGVLAAALDFPTVPAAHVADLNPLKKVSDIGCGGMFVAVVIDPNTNLPLLLSRGHGSSLISIGHLTDTTADVRLFDGTTAQLCAMGFTAINATKAAVHKGALVFGFGGPLSSYNGSVPLWTAYADGNHALLYAGVNVPAGASIAAFASNPAGNMIALLDVNSSSAYYAASASNNPTATALPAAAPWRSAAFGSNVFVAIAAGGTQAASSPDGVAWIARVMPAAAAWSAVASSGTLFAAVAGGASTQAATSADGITWTSRVLPVAADWSAVTHNGAQWCAVAKNSNVAATSADGITWTRRTLPTTADWCDVRWSSALGAWFAVASDGRAAIATSTDGIAWTSRAVGAPAFTFTSLFGAGGNTLYAVSASSLAAGQFIVAKSIDGGATWRYHQPNIHVGMSSSGPAVLRVLNGQFVAVAGAQPSANQVRLYTSADGITWSQNDRAIPSDPHTFQALEWNGSVYCLASQYINAGSQNANTVWTSPDLATWTARSCNIGITVDSWRIAAAGPAWVVLAGSSFPRYRAMVSTDHGASWSLGFDPGNGMSSSDIWYDALRDVVVWTCNVGSAAYLSFNKGASWTQASRVHATAGVSAYEAGFIRAGSNGSWAAYTTTTVVLTASKFGGGVKLTYPHGFTLATNRAIVGASGAIPVDQSGNRYYLTTANALVAVDAVPYIDNTKTAGEGAGPNLNYYMRVK